MTDNMPRIFALGVAFSVFFLTLFLFWILTGSLLYEGQNSGLYSELRAQRDQLREQLFLMPNEVACEMPDRQFDEFTKTPENLLPPAAYDGNYDESVAWIIVPTDEVPYTGSGFFISPHMLVTNAHVIEKVNRKKMIYVAMRGRGVVTASVMAIGNSKIGDLDLAVLKLTENHYSGKPMSINVSKENSDMRLTRVIASGYPGAVLHSMGEYEKIFFGDISSLPKPVLTTGVISSHNFNQNDIQIISHTADISPGNSGGPLTNMCGEVMGVNTFVYSDQGIVRSFAIGTGTLTDFLDSHSIEYMRFDQGCEE